MISVVVPAYNEARRLLPSLDQIIAFMDARREEYEVIVVDDGSTDGTAQTVRSHCGAHPRLRVESYPENRGKGHAVRYGAERARGDLILFTDADLSTPIAELGRLLLAIENGADIAIGTRAHPHSDVRVPQPFYRDRGGKLFNVMVRLLLLPQLRDTQCGFKLFRRTTVLPLFRRMREERFAFDVELLYLAYHARLRIAEVPVVWIDSPDSRVHLRHALAAFLHLFRIRWRHRRAVRE